ncbi:MAG: thioredoxin family protein [Planctomycetota bacterium]
MRSQVSSLLAAAAVLVAVGVTPAAGQTGHDGGLAQPAGIAPARPPALRPPAPRPPATAERRPLFRHRSLDSAWRASQQSGRPLMLYITAEKCHFCEKMVAETWSHPKIAHAVATRFEPIALVKEDNLEFVKRLGVRAYPTTLVVTPKGELAGHLRGFADPQKFATELLLPPQPNKLPVQPASYGER